MLPELPAIDVSSAAAAKKSVRKLDKWCASIGALQQALAAQISVTRLAVDNMRFANAHESNVMRAAAHKQIEKLKSLVAPVESLPA